MLEEYNQKNFLSCFRDDLSYIRNLIHEFSGMSIGEDKNYLFQTKLKKVALRNNCPDIESLLRILKSQKSSKLVEEITSEFTVNETFFFRDPQVFEFVRDYILPELKKKADEKQLVRIWSAAASTGQESYSLLMTIHENCPNLLSRDFSILATDISRKVLDHAKKGAYKDHEINRGLRQSYRELYFTDYGNEWRIKETFKKHVRFQYHNLTETLITNDLFDFIMLRNVLIYFDNETRIQVLKKIIKVLKPEGYLILGATEALPKELDGFKQLNTLCVACYQYCK